MEVTDDLTSVVFGGVMGVKACLQQVQEWTLRKKVWTTLLRVSCYKEGQKNGEIIAK